MGELAGARSPATAFSPIVGAELAADGNARASLPPGRERAGVAAASGSRLFLLGGVPLGEPLLMWWNCVARTPAEIAEAAAAWREGRFGTVGRYDGSGRRPRRWTPSGSGCHGSKRAKARQRG